MSLAATPQEWEALRANAEALLGAGMQVSLAAAEDLPIPFHRLYHGGLYYTGNGEVDPAAFVRGVARSLDENIHIFERTSVQGLKRMADRWVLQLEGTGAEVRAGAVLIASNAYTPSLLDVPINPTRGQVISTAPLGRVVVPFPMYANLGYQYWRQTADGRLVVGGWRDLDISGEVGTDEILHDSIQDQLDIFCREVGGHDISVEHRWAGVMGFSPDGFPMVGQVPGEPGLWIAAGYSGHGVAMAFTCGALVARRALGDAVFVPRAFATERFEIALRRGQEEPAGSR